MKTEILTTLLVTFGTIGLLSSAPLGEQSNAEVVGQEKPKAPQSVVGIGVVLSGESSGDYVTIKKVVENSPAAQAGILAGYHILSIEGKSVKGLNANQLADRIGEQEKTFELTFAKTPDGLTPQTKVKITKTLITVSNP